MRPRLRGRHRPGTLENAPRTAPSFSILRSAIDGPRGENATRSSQITLSGPGTHSAYSRGGSASQPKASRPSPSKLPFAKSSHDHLEKEAAGSAAPAIATDDGPPKAETGIAGFDEITGGGIPSGRTTLVVGGPGAGKTVFALETLVTAASKRREPGIFVAFEESSRHIIANAATFGWDLPALERQHLFFLDASCRRRPFNRATSTLRHARRARRESRADERQSDRLRRHRRSARAAREPGQRAARDVPLAGMAGAHRAHRGDHRQSGGQRPRFDRAVHLHALHGGRGRQHASPHDRSRLAPRHPYPEVPRLRIRRRRVSDDHLGDGSGSRHVRLLRAQLRRLDRARLVGRSAPRHHARRRLLPRLGRADLRGAGHGEDDARRRVRQGRVRARRARALRELRRGGQSDRAQHALGRHRPRPVSRVRTAPVPLGAH